MKQKLHIVIVEDDPDQEADLAKEIKSAFSRVAPNAIEFHIETITCEAEFLDRFESRPERMPDLFVVDLMLEWRQPWVNSLRELPYPAPDMDEAGVRCLQVVRNLSPKTPVLIWTMTNKDLRLGVVDDRTTFYLRKDRAVEGDLEAILKRLKLP